MANGPVSRGLHPLPPLEVIAYTAGLIDGEGCITFSDGRIRLAVSQSLNNRGDELCDWLVEKWGLGRSRRQDTSFGPCHHWHVDRFNDVHHVLTACRPYLIVKAARADEALGYLERRTGGISRGPWTPTEDAIVREHWREHDFAIAERLGNGRTPNSVMLRRRVLGLRKPRGGFAKHDS